MAALGAVMVGLCCVWAGGVLNAALCMATGQWMRRIDWRGLVERPQAHVGRAGVLPVVGGALLTSALGSLAMRMGVLPVGAGMLLQVVFFVGGLCAGEVVSRLFFVRVRRWPPLSVLGEMGLDRSAFERRVLACGRERLLGALGHFPEISA